MRNPLLHRKPKILRIMAGDAFTSNSEYAQIPRHPGNFAGAKASAASAGLRLFRSGVQS